MTQAEEFMLSLAEITVEESGESLVPIEADPKDPRSPIAVSENNAAGVAPIVPHIRAGLLEPLRSVATRLRAQGFLLQIEHAYRSPGMQVDLVLSPVLIDRVVRMVADEDEPEMEPLLVYRRLLGLVANTYIHGTHLSGSAIDTSILNLSTGEEVDRGGTYMDLNEVTPMDSPFIGEVAARNRARITAAFEQSGFLAYPYEFWHYSQGDAIESRLRGDSRPARYGPVTMSPDGSVHRLPPLSEVVPLDVVLSRIADRIAVLKSPQSNEGTNHA